MKIFNLPIIAILVTIIACVVGAQVMESGTAQYGIVQQMKLTCPEMPQKDCPELKNVSKLTFSQIAESYQALCIYGTSGSCSLAPLTGNFCFLNNIYFGPQLVCNEKSHHRVNA
jgi:hypothetical protein